MAVRQASIIWATVKDEQGRNIKNRPCLVISATQEIDTSDEVIVAAITSSLQMFGDNLPEDFTLLPYSADRHRVTGLTKRSAVCTSWLIKIKKSDIIDKGYYCPDKIFRVIAEKINSTDTK